MMETVYDDRNHMSRTISVTNLSFRTSIDDIYKAFSKFGKLVECRMMLNDRNESKGYAFIGFSEERDGMRAIEEMDGFHMDGRAIKVGWSIGEQNSSRRPFQQRY